MFKELLRKLFRIDETHELELFKIPHLDESSVPCEMKISRKRAADIGAILINRGSSFQSLNTEPHWYVQVEDDNGKHVCSMKVFSLEKARLIQEELYRFFRSVAANKPIIVVIRDFHKDLAAA